MYLSQVIPLSGADGDIRKDFDTSPPPMDPKLVEQIRRFGTRMQQEPGLPVIETPNNDGTEAKKPMSTGVKVAIGAGALIGVLAVASMLKGG